MEEKYTEIRGWRFHIVANRGLEYVCFDPYDEGYNGYELDNMVFNSIESASNFIENHLCNEDWHNDRVPKVVRRGDEGQSCWILSCEDGRYIVLNLIEDRMLISNECFRSDE